MPTRDLIVIGASAGGVQPLIELARRLPADLPAAVCIVVHTSPSAPGMLPVLLDGVGPLPAAFAAHGEPVRARRIYVAPPDHHLLLADHHFHLSRGPRENGFRPAVDPLFRTAAAAYGPRVIGVVLSGGLNDGTVGLYLIKQAGGIAIVQDPADALQPSMPASAMAEVDVDHVLTMEQIPGILVQLTAQPVEKGGPVVAAQKPRRPDSAEAADRGVSDAMLPGNASGFVCPECGGALWGMEQGKTLVFRCHVGHSFTGDGLLAQQGDVLENALWTALRALEENAALNRRLAQRMKDRLANVVAKAFEQRAADAERRAAAIRAILLSDSASDGRKNAKKASDSNLPLTRKVTRPRKKPQKR